MQPLDVGFFKPLNTYFSAAITTRLHEFPGKALNVDAISSLVGKAFPRAATVEVAINSFRKTGLWPPDRHVFTDADYAPAEVSVENRLVDEVAFQEHHQNEIQVRNSSTPVPQGDPTGSTTLQSVRKIEAIQPHDEGSSDDSSDNISGVPEVDNLFYISAQEIRPLLTTSGTSTGPRRTKKFKVSGVILTSTPYKDQLEIQKTTKPKTDVKKKKLAKRNLMEEETNESKKQKKVDEKTKQRRAKEAQDDKTECLICGESYDEDWIMCHICKR